MTRKRPAEVQADTAAAREKQAKKKQKNEPVAEPISVHFSATVRKPLVCRNKEKILPKMKALIKTTRSTNGGRSYQFIVDLTPAHTGADIRKWSEEMGGFVAAYNIKAVGSSVKETDDRETESDNDEDDTDDGKVEKEQRAAADRQLRRGRRRGRAAVADDVKAAEAAPAAYVSSVPAPLPTLHNVFEQMLTQLPPAEVRQEQTALALGDRGTAVAGQSVHMSASAGDTRATPDTAAVTDLVRQATQSLSLAIGATAVNGNLNQFTVVFQDCASTYAGAQLATVAERAHAVLHQLQEHVKRGMQPQVATMVSVALAQLLQDTDPDASRSLLVAMKDKVQGAPLTAEDTSMLADFTARLESAREKKKQLAVQQQMLKLLTELGADVRKLSQAQPQQPQPQPQPQLQPQPQPQQQQQQQQEGQQQEQQQQQQEQEQPVPQLEQRQTTVVHTDSPSSDPVRASAVRTDNSTSPSAAPIPRTEDVPQHAYHATDPLEAETAVVDVGGFLSDIAGRSANRQLTSALAEPRHRTNRTSRAFAGQQAISASVITRTRSVPGRQAHQMIRPHLSP